MAVSNKHFESILKLVGFLNELSYTNYKSYCFHCIFHLVFSPIILRISAIASQPRSDDWFSVMDYGHVTQILRRLNDKPGSDSRSSPYSIDKENNVPEHDLIAVELRRLSSRSEYHSEPRAPLSTRASIDLIQTENMGKVEIAAPQIPSVTKSTEELGTATPRQRKSSFLDVAASWATRPAWKSQEQLNQKPQPSTPAEDVFPKLNSRNLLPLSPIESPGEFILFFPSQ